MPASRRHKLLKKFKFNCNRKRLGRVRRKAKSTAPSMPIIKAAWKENRSVKENVANMGLSLDVNSTMKIPTIKESLIKEIKSNVSITEASNIPESTQTPVVTALEEEANAPREKKLALPKGQVLWLSYLIDKYGDDFKAMARDRRNLNQETWKQLKAKIKTFQSISEQWNEFVNLRDSE